MSIRYTFAGLALILGLSATPATAQFNGLTVTPDGGSLIKPANATGQTAVFTVSVTSVEDGIFTLACSTSAGKGAPRIGNCGVEGPNPVTVPAQGSASVTVTFDTYSAGFPGGTLTLSASTYLCDPEFDLGCEADDGTYNVTVTNVGFAPLVADTSHRSGRQDYGLCAAACFAATYAQGTVPYVSRDVPRNVTLVYNGDRADPHPFVHVDVAHDPASPYTPDHYELSMTVDGAAVTFVNGEQTLKFAYGGTAAHRLGGQFDASTWSTGVYPAVITVASKYAGGLVATAIPTKLIVVNENNSQVARGWTLAGIQRLYEADNLNVLITEGDGSAVAFERTCGTCAWTEPDGEFSILRDGQPGGGSGWTRVYRDSTKVVFDGVGQMRYVEDRFGSRTSISYNPAFAPRYITDPQNLTTTVWIAGGKLDYIRDPFNRTTDVTVDGSGRLTGIQDPDGVSTSFGYDGSLRLSTITDRAGDTSTLIYDAATPASRRLIGTRSPTVSLYGVGSVQLQDTLASWQTRGVPYGSTATPFTAPRSDTVRARLVDAAGHAVVITVDRYGQPHTVTDALGNVITTTYNADGQVLSINNPLGVSASYGYTAEFLVSSSVGGVETYFRKAPSWFVADSVRGDRQAARMFVNPSTGLVDSIRTGGTWNQPDSTMHWTRIWYDAVGRDTLVRDAEGHLVRRTVYAGLNGNRSKDSAQGQRATTYGHNTYGVLSTVSRQGLPTRSTTYDVLNRPTHFYDGVNPNPTVTWFGTLGVDSVVDPLGQVYGFVRNPLGWVTSEVDPTGLAVQYEYDRDGLVRRKTNRRNQQVVYSYDGLHRRTGRSGDNLLADSIVYSADGSLIVGISHISPGVRLSEDTLQLTAWRAPSREVSRRVYYGETITINYHYNGTTRLLDSVMGSGIPPSFLPLRYGRTPARGTLDSIGFGTTWTRFGFNPDLQATSVTMPGNTVLRSYNSTHRSSTIDVNAGSVAADRGLETDPLGQLTMHLNTFTNAGSRYGYDDLGRMVADSFITNLDPECEEDEDYGVICGQGYFSLDSVRTFAYDAVGNRLESGGDSYGTGNRIQQFAGCTYQTDADGNVTQRDCGGTVYTFFWNAENRLDSIRAPGDTSRYRYDAFGRLIRSWGNAINGRNFIWARDRLYAGLDSDADAIIEQYSYYPGLDHLHAIWSNVDGQVHFAHADGLGNVVAFTDPGANLTRAYEYDEWGQLVGGGAYVLGSRNPVQFKGAPKLGPNNLELYYMRNRWYEPKTGRFLSEDPIGLAGGINVYQFAHSNPVVGRDPSGLSPEDDCPDGTSPLKIGDILKCVEPWPMDPITIVAFRTEKWWQRRDDSWWFGGGYEEARGYRNDWGNLRSAWSGPRLSRTGFDELGELNAAGRRCAGSLLTLAGRVGVDLALAYVYGSAVVTGAVVFTSGWLAARGLVLTTAGSIGGRTGALEMQLGRVLTRLGGMSAAGTAAVGVPRNAQPAVSLLPGMNTAGFFTNGGLDCGG